MQIANIHFLQSSLLAFGLSLLILLLTFWGYRTKVDIEKISIYECGFNPYSQPRITFDIKFYLVSLIFIVFDIEVLFLFPLALEITRLSFEEIFLLIIFVSGIFLGIYYEICTKVLDFSRQSLLIIN